MSAFKALRDVSNKFENELRKLSTELFSAKIDDSFEDIITKKMRDLALFNSKLRLLQAKPLAVTPQVTEIPKNEQTTISDYTDTVTWKIIEQQVVKTLTQTHAVKNLITTPSRDLDPELVERKEKIIEQLQKYREHESQLRHLEAVLQEKEDELLHARQTWDESLSKLKDSQKLPQSEEIATGPLYKKLQVLISKMELMRWLIAKLVTSRTGGYDWATDPHKRLNALALARQHHTIQDYTES
ncbi:uncharacterized protein LOC124542230 [Vanessa cardui]|uniref:uncharacterized protein LOC124542230 n=1 Tax=Vanessa cardui TaxID=171605 RepID=UPI001F13CB13|nr:uncharacterized protein LOC124542230 [Vanessa cardui]